MPDVSAPGWVDIAMLAVVGLSALAGAVRGLTFEILSLLGWVAAWFAGIWLGPLLAPHLSIGAPGSTLNSIAAFGCAFVAVLILSAIIARAVSALVGKTPLRPLDRLLGGVFGIARALLVLLAVAIVVTYTPLARTDAWQQSQGAVWLSAILRELVPLVAPEAIEPPAGRTV